MYVPVYRKDQPTASVEQRRAALLGFTYSPFRAYDLLSSLFSADNKERRTRTVRHRRHPR